MVHKIFSLNDIYHHNQNDCNLCEEKKNILLK